jgi:cytochrome c556
VKSLSIASTAAVLFISLALPAPVIAGASDAIASRIAAYRELGVAFKNLNDELRGPKPSSYVLQYSARKIRGMADRQYELFPKGTGAEAGKSKALAAIWSDPAGFRKAQDNFTAKAKLFATASAGGNVGQIRLAAKELGRACSACHRQFRRED